jgi:hypothetical protein
MIEIPFSVPGKFTVQILSGEVRRVGVNLINSQSGRIVGHVQEAGTLASKLAGGFNPLLQAGQLASSVAANVQLQQVKAMLGTLQLVSSATLAVSAINLGVSAVGFIVLSRKLDGLSGQINRLEAGLSEVTQGIRRIDVRQRARDRAQITSIFGQADEAWLRTDATDIWRLLTTKLADEESYYRALLDTANPGQQSIIYDNTVPLDEVLAAQEALAHLVAARLKCLVLLNELEAAHHYAQNVAEWSRRTFRTVTPPAIADARSRHEAARLGKQQDAVRLDTLTQAQSFTGIVRTQQEFADSMPAMLGTMIERKIDGRAYVTRLRNEKHEDLLVLEALPGA